MVGLVGVAPGLRLELGRQQSTPRASLRAGSVQKPRGCLLPWKAPRGICPPSERSGCSPGQVCDIPAPLSFRVSLSAPRMHPSRKCCPQASLGQAQSCPAGARGLTARHRPLCLPPYGPVCPRDGDQNGAEGCVPTTLSPAYRGTGGQRSAQAGGAAPGAVPAAG